MALTFEGSLERCCRLCAEEQEVTVMIFSLEAEAMLLKNKLNQYLLIEVDEDDKLPKSICLQCCSKLHNVCDFIDAARKAQETLLNRSLLIDQIGVKKCIITNPEMKIEKDPLTDEESTEMEISVDPMMILQNSEEPLSPTTDEYVVIEDVTYLHSVDSENVTINLVRKNEKTDLLEERELSYKPFPCETCKRSFYTELALRNHLWVHEKDEKCSNYKCSTCNDGFDYKCDLIEHIKKHKSAGKCKICGRAFRTERNLASHMAAHMSAGSSFTCKVCGRSYSTLSNLKTHSITHSNDRPFHCHMCKKSFKRNQDLKFHINQHTGAKPYQCPFCEKCFASSGNCYSHRSRMHPGRRVDNKIRRRIQPRDIPSQSRLFTPKTPVTAVKGLFKYQCQLCEHSFMRRDNFTYHMYQHTGEKPFHCSFCSEKFVTRRGLLIHHDKDHPNKDRPLALLSKNVLLK